MDNVKISQDIELLLKDLSARLPYGVKLWHESYVDLITLHSIDATHCGVEISIDSSDIGTPWWNNIEQVKPYLFPLSSMTEEQFLELTELCNMYDNYHDYNPYEYWGIQVCRKHIHGNKPCFSNNYKAIDWFNKNHFDYRGLIPMGLAIDATGLNIYES